MKRKLKGFTLVECLVALAILGIASMVMAQIYAGVARSNKTNHLVNTSLANQMAYVEKSIVADTVSITTSLDPVTTAGGKPTGPNPPYNVTSGTNSKNNMRIERLEQDASTGSYVIPTDNAKKEAYSYPVNIYVLKSRDRQGNVLGAGGDAGYTENDYNLRYKYFTGV